MDSINHCIAFLVFRMLNEDLCKKAGLTYENIEKAALRIVGK